MIRFPANVVWGVKTAIEGRWTRGIQNEKEIFLGAYEFQLKGNPWTGQGDESVPARVLMCVFEPSSIPRHSPPYPDHSAQV
jgi:hypothetical protein